MSRHDNQPGASLIAALLALSGALAGVVGAGAPDQGGGQPPPADPGKRIQQALRKQFDAYLTKPEGLAAKVRRECRCFPEGDLFPYLLPAYAYTNLAAAEPAFKPKAADRVAKLIELASPAVVRRVAPPGRKLEKLTDYRHQAVYLGQFNLALGCYKLLGGDDRYDKAHKAISDALYDALVKGRGKALRSYPTMTWSFDTIPCLLSLKLYEQQTGKPRTNPLISRHLRWLRENATDKTTHLPYSRINGPGRSKPQPPRGCELSWRVCLAAQLDTKYASQLYRDYTKAFWTDAGVIAGFREYPAGRDRPQDVDSGPILKGVGMTATGFGIGAAAAAEDAKRHARLVEQAANLKTVLRMLTAADPKNRHITMDGLIDLDSPYCTGFLMGDACLFYSITWHNWQDLTETDSTGAEDSHP